MRSGLPADDRLDDVDTIPAVTLKTQSIAAEDLDSYRRELTAYCYRMLGSGFDAEDAVQETFLRAWRASDRFEGRSSLRSWLYKIATNVCLDALRSQKRRARPMELGPSRPPEVSSLATMLEEHSWVSPIADKRVLAMGGDPAELVAERETIRLAFVAALQHLPARQRAVLILSEVLRWQSSEIADLLETSVPAVNSALQRARATLSSVEIASGPAAIDTAQRELLASFADAFERYDIERLVTLLRDDAIQSMPPYAMWLRGASDIGKWMLGPGSGCRGSRLIATEASGCPAYAQYRQDPNGGHVPWALHVIEISGDRISGLHSFLEADRIFASFDLPPPPGRVDRQARAARRAPGRPLPGTKLPRCDALEVTQVGEPSPPNTSSTRVSSAPTKMTRSHRPVSDISAPGQRSLLEPRVRSRRRHPVICTSRQRRARPPNRWTLTGRRGSNARFRHRGRLSSKDPSPAWLSSARRA